MNYCQRCGGRLTETEAAGRRRPVCPACGWMLFRNPVPVALALVMDRGRLLLVQRSVAPLRGFWAPPGGYVEWDESVAEAAVREAREETGLTVALRGVAGVHSAPGLGIVLVVYWASVTGGALRCGDESTAFDFFPSGQWPPAPGPVAPEPLDTWFHTVLRELLQQAADGLDRVV